MSLSFVALDFETPNFKRNSACSVGLVKVDNGKITAQEHRLINPQDYFDNDCVDIHGITPEDVEDAPYFPEVWKELLPMLEGAEFIAAHNASFDKAVLCQCCESYTMSPPDHRFICTVQLSRRIWNIRPTRLNDVCDYLGIELNHHNALSDALACAQIVMKANKELL